MKILKIFSVITLCLLAPLGSVYGSKDLNVHGTNLELCSTDPLTGFTRNGYCETNEYDQGLYFK